MLGITGTGIVKLALKPVVDMAAAAGRSWARAAGADLEKRVVQSVIFVPDRAAKHGEKTPAGHIRKRFTRSAGKAQGRAASTEKPWYGKKGKYWLFFRKPAPAGHVPYTHVQDKRSLKNRFGMAEDARRGTVLVGLRRAGKLMAIFEVGGGGYRKHPFLRPQLAKIPGTSFYGAAIRTRRGLA